MKQRGSITRIGPSSFRARIQIEPLNGKRRWETKVFHTKREAEAFRTKVLSELDSGRFIRVAAMTFDELCDAYLKASASRIEATSLRWYTRVLRDHARPVLGHMKIATIKAIDVQCVLDSASDVSRRNTKRGLPLAPSTLRNLLVAIKAVFAWAVRMELIARNPALAVTAPKVHSREYPDFGSGLLRSVLEAVQRSEFHVLVPFALMTGARRGELVALRWQDVDLFRGRYSIRRSAAILDGEQIYKSPKSARSRRTEALPRSLVELLEQHRKEQARRYDRIGLPLPSQDAFVFDRLNGEPWNANELSRRWTRFVRRANLPRIRWHDLRHAFASISHDAGESLHSISNALGHSSLQITSSIYVHTSDEGKSKRAARLDDYVASAVRDTDVTIEPPESSETA